jgi:hypothetical protein
MHINDHPFGSYSLPSDAADHPHVHPRATRLPQDARRQISSAGGQETWEAFHLIMASGHANGILIQRSLVLTKRQQIGCKFDQRPLALKNTNLMQIFSALNSRLDSCMVSQRYFSFNTRLFLPNTGNYMNYVIAIRRSVFISQ